ncbi:winged helix-turn-helix transcriptional regulator [Streptomyces sp. NPDC056672]|uniref:winged helix-turn-helix transcriptional regulator n=1 Tax=Streptomyces sp. NPDC056672 TaxID=3345906 RepID=UPI0036CA8255
MTTATGARQGVPDPASDPEASVFPRGCPSRTVMEELANKWVMLVLLALRDSDYRFNALRRRVEGVSEKMLSQTLQTLERDGMVTRHVRTAIPPCVEYSITPLGAKIADRLHGLVDLVEASVTTVFAARDAYDARWP